MAKGFWKLGSDTQVRTPVSYLREQATALREATEGILVGDVRQFDVQSRNPQLGFSLMIVAPALNNYRYRVLSIRQPIVMYPLMLESTALDETLEIANEEQLVAALERILGSDVIQRVVAALLAQARETS